MNHRGPPQSYARACGLLYLYIIVVGIAAEMLVRDRLIVAGDAAATAANILANETLFRLGFTGELLQLAFDLVVAVLLYMLFRQVSRPLALVATFMRLACAMMLAVGSALHPGALELLKGGEGLRAMPAEQAQAMALWLLGVHADLYVVALVFFGFACLALGWLILRARFFPSAIGWLLLVAGAGYLVNSFANLLHPPLAAALFPAALMPALVAELALALWLLARGVDVARWREGAVR